MQWCQDYAFQNRRHMLELMVDVVEGVAKSSPDMEQAVNIHHNFCQCERCTYTVKLQCHLSSCIAHDGQLQLASCANRKMP